MAEMFDDNSNAADPMLEYAGNVPYSAEKQRVQDSIHAIDAFFRLLPVKSGLEPSKILLVIDGIRPHLYSEAGLGKAQGSYFSQMRAYFIDQASNLGYEFVDLQDVFKYNYLNHQKRFEFPTDAHWNAHGHAVVAEAIGNSKLFSHTVSGIGPKPNSRESGQP
jgi:hypothetical protein